MTRKLVVEAIGTFFLMLTVAMVVLGPGAGALGPIAIGFALMVMVYAGGHVSGAHYNPAVSLAIRVRGAATNAELGGYVVAQLLGAALAVVAARAMLPGSVEVLAAELDGADMAVAEFLFTFALAWAVLNVATSAGTKGNSYFGLAIGSTVTAGAFAVGPVSGAVFNPAVALGLTLLGVLEAGVAALMVVIQLAAGIAAATLFAGLDLGVDKPTTATPAEQRGLRQAGEPEI